jgi:hypothetical protein
MDEMKAEKDMIQKVETLQRDLFFHHFQDPYLWKLLIIGMHIGILTTFKKKIPLLDSWILANLTWIVQKKRFWKYG